MACEIECINTRRVMDEMDQNEGARDVYMRAKDLTEIERIAES